MKSIIKTVSIVSVSICGILGILYYAFAQIDFIGEKDPKVVADNVKRWNNTLLSAEYRNGTDYCNVDLLDSINIQINTGNNSTGIILEKEYKISGDTILVRGLIDDAGKYINSDKLLIRNNKLLYKIDSHGNYDSTKAMTIKFNNLKR